MDQNLEFPPADLMDTMQETSRAYMIADKEGRCDVLPAKDQMMKGDMAMEMACENVSALPIFFMTQQVPHL